MLRPCGIESREPQYQVDSAGLGVAASPLLLTLWSVRRCFQQHNTGFRMNCPNCKSARVTPRQAGKKTAAGIGFFTGAAAGAISVLRGAQLGMVAGALIGPAGSAAGGVVGAALAAMCAGSAGGAMGAALGSAADEVFIDNRECLDCGFTFREERGGSDNSTDTPPHD